MSRRGEQKTALELLELKLAKLALEKEVAAKNLLKSLARTKAIEEVIDDVNNMISIAVAETKKRAKAAIDAL